MILSLQTLKKLSSFKAFEIINHLPLFCDLTPEDKRLIANEHNLFCFIPKNDTFITQGDMDKCFYLLLSGSAKVVHDCIDFDELSAGDVIGVIGFIRDHARTASVTAVNDILAMKFNRGQFQRLPANARESIKDHIMEELVRRIDRLNHKFHSEMVE